MDKQGASRKKEIYGIWKKAQTTWKDYRNIVRVCRDITMKIKAHPELSLVRAIKDNKKDFYKYISSKRKIKENMGSLINQTGVLVMEDLLNAIFASVSTAEASPQTLEIREAGERKSLLGFRVLC